MDTTDRSYFSFEQLSQRAYDEFSDLLDYAWKSPSLIKTQEQIELEKLESYFPNDPERRDLRWGRESQKLYRVFPYLLAIGNLFAASSLFEIYLLLLARSANYAASTSIMGRGQGIQKALTTLHELGIDTYRIDLWSQVDAALKIRNCLMHASGLLEESREKDELRRIVRSRLYFPPARRKKSVTESDGKYITLIQTPLGERLQITNHYSWITAAYLRDYYVELCKAGQMHIGWPRTKDKPNRGTSE